MKAIVLVSVVLLDACAVFGGQVGLLKDWKAFDDTFPLQNSEVSAAYNPLGCYDLRILKNEKVIGRYKSSAASVEECEDIAWDKDLSLFGIKRTKKDGILHCIPGKKKAWNRKRGNFTQVDTCEEDTGSLKSIFMYRKNEGFINQCLFNNKTYDDYEQVELYNSTDDQNYVYCQRCTCRRGKLTNCGLDECSGSLCTSEERHYPPDICCPYCKPPSGKDACNLKGLKPGDSFEEDNPERTFRYRCFCYIGNHINCEKIQITGVFNNTRKAP